MHDTPPAPYHTRSTRCESPWCYVDPTDCELAGAEFSNYGWISSACEAPLTSCPVTYSYATCGAHDEYTVGVTQSGPSCIGTVYGKLVTRLLLIVRAPPEHGLHYKDAAVPAAHPSGPSRGV